MQDPSTGVHDKGEVTVINGGISIRARRPRHLAPIHYKDAPAPAAPAHLAPSVVHPCNKLGHSFCFVRSFSRQVYARIRT